LQLHAGKNNLIENNVFVNCPTNLVMIDAVSTGFPIGTICRDSMRAIPFGIIFCFLGGIRG
jgi:hypothetical protein